MAKTCQMGVAYEAFYGVQHCEEPAVAAWTFGRTQDPLHVCPKHDKQILDDMNDLVYDPSRTMRTTLEDEDE